MSPSRGLRDLPAPPRLRSAARTTVTAVRRVNVSRRPLPDFLIVGAQKAGTTSLHQYLCAHPRVAPSLTKEVHYFDLGYDRGESWYRAHFDPPRRGDEVTGESSPYYLFHPLAPARAAADLPEARIIVLLRNPIDRAFSHHNHELSVGRETLPFEDALAREAERLAGEEERILADPRYLSAAHQRHSYLRRGFYAEQLERWFGRYDRDRFLVLSAEDLFAAPAEVVATTQRFLGLEPVVPDDLTPRNARSYDPLPAPTRARLRAEFAPRNERLYELVGRDFGW
jgi:hypothetical protein